MRTCEQKGNKGEKLTLTVHRNLLILLGVAVNRNVGGSNPPRGAKIFVLNKLQSLGRAFGCEPNGPCTDCCIPTLLRFLCHKNVTRIDAVS